LKTRYILFFIICLFVQSAISQNFDDACAEWEIMSNSEININKHIKESKTYIGKVSDSCKIRIYKRMSFMYSRLVKPDSAMLYIDKAIEVSISDKRDDELADCYGQKSLYLSRKSDFEEAKIYLDKARVILNKYPNNIYWVGHYYHLENYYKNTGDDNEDIVVKYSDSALQAGIRLKDTSNIANLYQNLGVRYYNKRNYELALKNLLKSLEIKESKNASQLEGSYYTVGVCVFKMENFDLAEEYFQKAITLSEKTDNRNVNLLANFKLANLKNKKKDNTKALEYIEKAILLAKKLNSTYQSSETLREKGNIYKYGFDSIQKAEKLYLEAYEYAKKGNNKDITRLVIWELYDTYIKQKKYNTAKKYLDKLEEIEKKSNNISSIQDWHLAAGNYYKATKTRSRD